MRQRPLPHTDLMVSEICFGAGGVGSAIDQDTAFRFLDRYIDQGGNFIDTARAYAIWTKAGAGVSEAVIGRWLKRHNHRQDVVVATKGGHPEWETLTTPRMSRDDVVSDCEASLRALGIETIPLYWLHRDDPSQPVEELLETCELLVAQGKIRYYGCSNWSVKRLQEAQHVAEEAHSRGFVANQPMWSLAQLNVENMPDKTLKWMDEAMVSYHKRTELPVIPYSAQARGVLAKLVSRGWNEMPPDLIRDYQSQKNQHTYERLRELAETKQVSITALAIRWMSDNQDFVTIPIVSGHSSEQWEEILQSTRISLSASERESLTPVSDENIEPA